MLDLKGWLPVFGSLFRSFIRHHDGQRALAIGTLLLLLGVAAKPVSAAPYADFVIDANTGKVLNATHADELRYPASLTKMMTLYVMFEMLQQQRMTLDTPLRVSANAASAQPSKLGLKPGDTISVRDAMRAIVTKSANDAAITIAENLGGTEAKFARYMTWRARKLGMRNTTFRNASGLPDPEQRSTARDFVTLALRLNDDFPKYWGLFKTQYFVFRGRRYRNHNSLLFNFPGADGLKTGYIRASGFNLVTSVRRDGKHVIGAVFGGRTAGERNARMRGLMRAALGKASTKKSRRPSGGEALVAAATPEPVPAKVAAAETTAEAKPLAQATKAVAAVPPPKPVTKAQRAGLTAFLKQKVFAATARTLAKASAPTKPAEPAIEEDAADLPAAKAPIKARADDKPLNAPIAAGPYHIQLGAFDSEDAALARLAQVSGTLKQTGESGLIAKHKPVAVRYDTPERVWYRARFAAYDKAKAQSVCETLKARRIDCIVMSAK